jgi:CubicO group peptidase (beta-lactamase class C family)
VYEIGSVTKQFTAAAVLLLAEDGKLSLDDDLSAWMPGYPLGGRAVPLRRLLDHTSGIKGYTEMPVFGSLAVQRLPRDSLVTLFSAEPFDFEPGEALIYNNSAYFLLGLIIEKASGTSYEEFVETRVFEAAGMERSRYCHKDELTPGRAKGYQTGPDGLRPADYLDHTWPYAAGSLCSTVRDLLRWNQTLHGDGEGGDLLTMASYRTLVTPGTLADGTRLRYAGGLTVTDRDGKRRISHGGGIFGYLSELRYFPEEDLSIVVLVNTAGPTSPAAIAATIEDAVLGPEAPIVPRGFGGGLAPFLGRYRGPARGRRMTAVVSEAGGELRVRMGAEDPEPVRWLGGTTFANGATRFTFVGGGDRFDVLRVDQVGGVYVLHRIRR